MTERLLIIIIVFAAVVLLYLLSLRAGNGRQQSMRPFMDTKIAHRGLFNNRDIPENSMPAFRKAIEYGYGIELDVQMTKDGKLVVFHDPSLKRMCGAYSPLTELSFAELQSLTLLDTSEKIPLLEDVLNEIGGRVPLIVEIKPDGCFMECTKKTAALLDRYPGLFCIESFHPMIVFWFRKHHPDVIRGQLSTNYFKEGISLNPVVKFLLTNLMLDFLTRPDFIAYNHVYRNQFSYRICRKLYPVVNAAWTVRSRKEMDAAEEVFQIIIFDHFLP